MDPTTLVGSGGTFGLLGLSVGLLIWLLRIWQRERRNQDEREERMTLRISELEKKERACQRRVDILAAACRAGGVAVPDSVWEG